MTRKICRKRIVSKDKSVKINCFMLKQSEYLIENQNKYKKEDKCHNNVLKLLDPSQFIVEKQGYDDNITIMSINKENQRQKQKQTKSNHHNHNKNKSIRAFWTSSHKLVSLFPLQYTQCIVFNHKNILPVYGEVKINSTRYVVSNQYKQSTLKDLIKQFGPFSEQLCKFYLIQIIQGVQQMHNSKMAHNRLRTQTILYNKQGQLVINIVKSSSRPLSQKQKQSKLYQYSPQTIFSKTNSNLLISDIWSIGILLIDMLIDVDDGFEWKYCEIHPYNYDENKFQIKGDMIIVDNIRQLYVKEKQDKYHKIQMNAELQEKINQINHLSVQCKTFIQACLILNSQNRPSVKQLKYHQFLRK